MLGVQCRPPVLTDCDVCRSAGADSAQLCLILLLGLRLVSGQGSCDSDGDCSGKYPCCSKFGYCGDGPGYCTQIPEEVPEEVPKVPDIANKTGCYLPNYEIVGGDLPLEAGGGGLLLDQPGAEAGDCLARCDDNPLCLWFTFEAHSKLCFLKSTRGFLRRRSAVSIINSQGLQGGGLFTSGATFEDGCVKVMILTVVIYVHNNTEINI